MTYTTSVSVFSWQAQTKVQCREAIHEIEQNNGQPLSSDRLKEHLEKALGQGFVGRVIVLAELAGTTLPLMEKPQQWRPG